ncbi:AbrB/MazE/SpoVT family DNA-binding domain-containing protein [Buttiauxella agrestis]
MTQIAIKKSGNSVTVRIPSAILKALSLKIDDPVNIEMEEGRIVLTPINPVAEVHEPKAIEAGSLAEAVREQMGLTQQGIADFFGITLSAWQKKEQGVNRLSVAEQHLFKMLSNNHPDYVLLRRGSQQGSYLQKACEAATNLALYLSGRLVLPSKAHLLQSDLAMKLQDYCSDWTANLNDAVDGVLPDELTILRAKMEDLMAENAELKKRLSKK